MAKRKNGLDVMYGKRKPLDKMTKEEMAEELDVLRILWDWVDDKVKYYVSRVGQMAAITRRDTKRFIGTLLNCEFEITHVNLEVFDRVYDPTVGAYFNEQKIIKVPVGSIYQMDFITERELWEDKPTVELGELGDADLTV